MALRDEGPQLSRVGRPTANRAPTIITVLTVAFVLLALVKPWTFGDQPASLPSVRPPAASGAARSPGASAVVADGPRLYPQCFSTSGWRVATLQHDETMQVRTVWPVALSAATTPAEALAAERTVTGNNVRGIGFCAPGSDGEAQLAHMDRVSLWLAEPNSQLRLVGDAATIDPALADLGEVYLAPPPALAVDGAWPSGGYLFMVDRGRVASPIWFALRVVGLSRSPSSPPPPPRWPRIGAEIAWSGHPQAR